MTEGKISVLLIEDDPGYARMIQEMIAEFGKPDLDLTYSDTLTKGLDSLAKENFDVILLDLTLPDSDGLETLLRIKGLVPDIPIVVLTSLEDEKIALKAVQESAQDYIYKGDVRPTLLIRAIKYAVERKRMLQELQNAFENQETVVKERTEELSIMNIQLQNEIEEKKQAEHALRDNEELLKATIESTADGIFVINENGEVTHSNARFAELWDIPEKLLRTKNDEELLKFFLDQLIEPNVFLSKVSGLYGTKKESLDILKFKDGRIFERYTRPLVRNGKFSGRVWSFRDITKSKLTERKVKDSEERFRNIAERSSDMIFEMDIKGNITYLSQAAVRITGYDLDEIVGQSFYNFMAKSEAERAEKIFSRISKGKNIEGYEFEITKKSGAIATIEINASPISRNDKIFGSHGIARDISYRKEMKEELDILSITDTLTGLLNKQQFQKNIKYEMKRAKRSSYPLTLILFSIDDFKSYVEKTDRVKGDRLLREIGNTIGYSVREDVDNSYRIGWNNFAVILPCTTEEQGLVVAERVVVMIARKIKTIKINFGIASHEGQRSASDIIKTAEKDLKANKLS